MLHHDHPKIRFQGPQVACLQTSLGLTADGNFGPQTKSAVITFQQNNGLTADGVVGLKTIATLKTQPPVSPLSGVANDATLTTALEKLIARPDIQDKLRGPQGPAGPTGFSGGGGVTIIPPNPIINYAGGSLFSATDLSSTNFITNNAKIATLDVSGNSTLTGGLSVAGASTLNSLNVSGAFNLTGNLAVDTNTLFVDSVNHRVGIGTTAPGYALDIVANTNGVARLTSNASAGLRLNNTGASGLEYHIGSDSGGSFFIYDETSHRADLYINSIGDVGLGTGAYYNNVNFQVYQSGAGAGTVSTPGSSTTLTGVGTQFTNTFKVGDVIVVAGETRTIATITSNTVLDVTVAFSSTPRSAVTYSLTGGTRFSVLGNGNVGIGTTRPAGLFDINGKLTVLSSGLVGIGTTAPRAGLEVAKYGDWISGANIYPFPAGNVFAAFGDSIAGADNWIGIRGHYAVYTGSANIMLQAGFSNIGQAAGNYIASDAATGDLSFGAITTGGTTATAATKTERMRVTNSGNVGIGTTAPFSKLSFGSTFNANYLALREDTGATGFYGLGAWNSGGNYGVGIYSGTGASTPSTSNPKMLIDYNGNVGIGTTAPAVTLAVVGDIRTGTSGTNGCIQNFAGTALAGTCSSDASLKTVVSNVTGILDKFTSLDLVTYHWNQTASDLYHNNMDALNTGYIAQQVEQQFPELVSIDSKGYRQLNYTTLSLYGLEAIKEMNLNLDAISGVTTPAPTTESTSFATAFFKNLKTTIGAWLADATNGISNIFATTITAKNANVDNLCVSDANGKTCITRTQLDAMLAGASGSGSGSGTPPAATCSDGIKNQDETGIDIGGVCTPAVTLSSIAITIAATKLSYTVGDALDISGLVVTGTYSDATTKVETITPADVSGFDSTAPITGQVLTISVGGKTVTYTIDVVQVAQ